MSLTQDDKYSESRLYEALQQTKKYVDKTRNKKKISSDTPTLIVSADNNNDNKHDNKNDNNNSPTTPSTSSRDTKATAKKKVKSASVKPDTAVNPSLLCKRILDIPRIGVQAAQSLMSSVLEPQSRALIDDLLQEMTAVHTMQQLNTVQALTAESRVSVGSIQPSIVSAPGDAMTETDAVSVPLPLAGKTVVFTGHLVGSTRTEATKACETLGK